MTSQPETDLADDPKAVDVSSPETQATVQCESVYLYSSTLQFLGPGGEEKATRISFKIQAMVVDQVALCDLESEVIFIPEPEEPAFGWSLRFTIIGRFSASQDLTPEDLGEFVKFNALTILWPYAREFASDQIRRVGEYQLVLPVINPQVVTKNLIEDDLVEVMYVDSEAEETT